MADRFQKVFSLSPNLYADGCPIIIEAGALQKDTETGNIIAQIKMCNIGNEPVSSCKVSLKAYATNGNEVEGIPEFTYLDLNAARGAEFGTKVPIMLPDRVARSFSIDITEIVFTDGTVKTMNGNQWKAAPEQRSVDKMLQDDELVRQYKIETGFYSDFVPEKEDGLFLCTCGAINLESARECYKCGNTYEKLTKCLDKDYLIGKIEEKRANAEYKKEETQRKVKKAAKVSAQIILYIAFAITTVIFGLVLWAMFYLLKTTYSSYSFIELLFDDPRTTALFFVTLLIPIGLFFAARRVGRKR